MANTLNGMRTKKNRKLFYPAGCSTPRLTMALEKEAMKKILRRASAEQKPAAFIARELINLGLASSR